MRFFVVRNTRTLLMAVAVKPLLIALMMKIPKKMPSLFTEIYLRFCITSTSVHILKKAVLVIIEIV